MDENTQKEIAMLESTLSIRDETIYVLEAEINELEEIIQKLHYEIKDMRKN
jgi:uncharacterized coiled-coil protein SlyX